MFKSNYSPVFIAELMSKYGEKIENIQKGMVSSEAEDFGLALYIYLKLNGR